MVCILNLLVILSIIISAASSTDTSPAYPEVTIPQGKLVGQYLTSSKGRVFSSFTGIPYAKPPLGPLRFEPPAEPKPWVGTLNATQPHTPCTQVVVVFENGTLLGQEDCLFLNVYTPKTVFPPPGNSYPVIVYIHGGGQMFGNGNYAALGPELFMNKNVVLVVINYRLGTLGFFSTGDSVVPGNNGLKDQNMAIKWTKRNIARFGGNPDRITLMGQSAGGASVEFHMISPLSRDLIKGVIAESGSAISPWALSSRHENQMNSRKLATMFDCPVWDTRAMVRCLKQKDAIELTLAQNNFYKWLAHPLVPFKPVIEPNLKGAMLVKSPIDAIKAGEIAQVPLITGVNTQDGNFLNPSVFLTPSYVTQLNDDFNNISQYLSNYYNTALDVQYVNRRMRQFYFGDADITQASRPENGKMITDGWFLAPVNKIVCAFLKYTRNPVYNYAFGYHGNASLCTAIDPTYTDAGVCHFDELLYLLPSKESFPTYVPSDEDKEVSELMTTMWVNFATTGKPTLDQNPKWEPVRSNDLEYYFIKSPTDLSMRKRLYWDRDLFWRTLPIVPDYY